MPKHAFLSASSSHRWLACPPSAMLCANVNDETSDYAKQGTQAHELCQYKLEKFLGRDPNDPTPDLDLFDKEMDSCTDDYLAFVSEQIESIKAECADPLILVEERLDFSRWIPEGFGTGDAVIVADKVLHVIDFKYGLGVIVDAKDNPQMMCYALGALELYGCLYDIELIKLSIFQPRRSNISTYEISKKDLLSWAENTLAPTAALAYSGDGDFKAGEHCQFCKIKSVCKERANYSLELAKYDFVSEPVTLTDEEIADILSRIDVLISWANDIKEYALQQALSGVHYPGYKVVEGRSNRKYMDENAVADAVKAAGFNPYEEKLLNITSMTSMLGKKLFEEILGALVTKPQGKPTLVPESDKRPALNTAIDDFNE